MKGMAKMSLVHDVQQNGYKRYSELSESDRKEFILKLYQIKLASCGYGIEIKEE